MYKHNLCLYIFLMSQFGKIFFQNFSLGSFRGREIENLQSEVNFIQNFPPFCLNCHISITTIL